MSNVWKKQKTVFRLNDRTVPKGIPGAKRVTVNSRKWYGTVNGKQVPLCVDKQAARTMLTKLQSDAALHGVGVCDPFAIHNAKPLADHLTDYVAHLRGKGNSENHVSQTDSRIRAIFDGCEFKSLREVDAAPVNEWLTALRTPKAVTIDLPPVKEFTPAAVSTLLGISGAALRAAIKRHNLKATGKGKKRRFPRETVEAILNRMNPGCGLETVNHYVRAVRGFFRWMVRSKRLPSNPLDTLTLLNSKTDIRHGRRELTESELRSLFVATRKSTRVFRGLTGTDRFHLYLTAAGTGFRANALANLNPSDFDLNEAGPVVTLAARFAKNRKQKTQPLPSHVAAALREYLAGKPANSPVWGGTWARDHRGAEMLRIDLDAAGIAYVTEGPDGPEYADFHALRHSYLTLGGRSGIDLRTLQDLAGHSKPELTARYSHRRLYDLAGAVEKLPNLIPSDALETAQMKATGTDPSCTSVARTPFNNGPVLWCQGTGYCRDGV